MTSRVVSASAALWTALYGVGYLLLIRQQDEPSVAWWYLVLLACAMTALAGHVAGTRQRYAVVGAVLLALAALVAIASIGIFLLPAVVAAIAAAAIRPARSRPSPALERAVQP